MGKLSHNGFNWVRGNIFTRRSIHLVEFMIILEHNSSHYWWVCFIVPGSETRRRWLILSTICDCWQMHCRQTRDCITNLHRPSLKPSHHVSYICYLECHRVFSLLRGEHDWHAFSRLHAALVPSTSHSSSTLSVPLHRPTTVLLAFLVIFSPQLYPARWCLPEYPLTTCPNHRSHLFTSVSYFPMCSVTFLSTRWPSYTWHECNRFIQTKWR